MRKTYLALRIKSGKHFIRCAGLENFLRTFFAGESNSLTVTIFSRPSKSFPCDSIFSVLLFSIAPPSAYIFPKKKIFCPFSAPKSKKKANFFRGKKCHEFMQKTENRT